MLLITSLRRRWDSLIFRRKWRSANAHNHTYVKSVFNMDLVSVGKMTYGQINVFQSNTYSCLHIGNFCSIADEVRFLVSADHDPTRISTYPFKAMCLTGELEATSKGNIIVEDDVWIGIRAIILSGVRIGQGAIVAAGAVVTKDVPPYAVVGGVPAKVIRYRFPSEIIEELMKVDYSKLDKELVQNHVDDLYRELTDVKQIEWMPRK